MAPREVKTTDPQGELLTQVDNQNQVIGSIGRRQAHETPGIFYRTIFVLVRDQNDKVLVQRRSPTKDLYPNCWDLSVGGHVKYGESYVETAVKEVGEELGISVKEEDLIDKGEVLVRLPQSGEYFRIFEYRLKPGQTITASQEEIGSTDWMTIEEIKKSMAEKTLQWYSRPEQVIAALY